MRQRGWGGLGEGVLLVCVVRLECYGLFVVTTLPKRHLPWSWESCPNTLALSAAALVISINKLARIHLFKNTHICGNYFVSLKFSSYITTKL